MKIYIDMCHGCGRDRGANGYLNEEKCSDMITIPAAQKLKALGHDVLVQRPSGDMPVQSSLNWRCQQANRWGADIFISCHNNAGGGLGAEIYTYKGQQLEEAQRWIKYITEHGGNSRGIKDGSGLAVIRGTSMKAMLIENFFVDNKQDCDFFNNNVDMFSDALVYAITGYNKPETPIYNVDWVIVYDASKPADKEIAEFMYWTLLGKGRKDTHLLTSEEYDTNSAGDFRGDNITIIGGSLANKYRYGDVLAGSDRHVTAADVYDYLKSKGI